MSNFYIEYETSSGQQTQSFTTGALLRQFIMDNKADFINHLKVVAKLPEITDGRALFSNCNAISIDLSEFDTSAFTTMREMFLGNKATSLDLTGLNTSNVTNMLEMFRNCTNLTNLDLSSFDTSNTTNVSFMFQNCTSLESVDLSSFDTSGANSFRSMFMGCSSLTILDLNHFDVSSVTNMFEMFRNSPNLKTIYCNNDWSDGIVSDSRTMFGGCTSLVGAIPYDSSKVDINYANPTTGYFTIKQEPETTGIGKILFNANEFKKIMFDNKEYVKIMFNNEIIWGKGEIPPVTPDFYIEYETSSGAQYQEFATGAELRQFIIDNKTTFINNCKVVAKLPEITDMSNMFLSCSATSLDLSSFNTSNVTNMYGMFGDCSATTGYARTQADADKLNASSNKPAGLVFVVR